MPPTAHLRATQAVGFVEQLGQYGEQVALIQAEGIPDAPTAMTYAELSAAVAAERVKLTGEHARRLVLIALDRSIDAIVTYLAALASGHVALLAPEQDADPQRGLVETYDPDVVARRSNNEWTIIHRRSGSTHDLHDDLALLLSTSGSTGSPKLVRLSQQNLQANANSIVEALSVTDDHRAVSTLPLTYSYGLSVLHSHLNVGASLLLTERSVVDPRFWDSLAQHEVTTLPGVPHTFDLLDRVGFDRQQLPQLAHVTVAGGRLAPDRVRRYAELGGRRGFDLHVMYGQTEATARITTLDPARAHLTPDSIGQPIPGGSIELDPVQAEQPGVGEIVYRGPNVMLGYAESREDLALGATVDRLRTGDLATRDADGSLRIVGRRSRIAKVFGLRVDLDRVEQLLASEGLTASVTGQEAGLCVVAEGRVDLEHLADRTARLAGLPIHVVHARVVETLPRFDNGKLDRSTADCECNAAAPTSPPANSQSRAVSVGELTALYAQLLGRPDATPQDSFVSLGGDSLSYVEVSVRLEAMLGQLVPDWHTRSLDELASAQQAHHGHRRWSAQIDTGVALRALAIVAIVGTHIGLLELLGGAHVLLGLAGFSMARFLLDPRDPAPRAPKIFRGAGRIAVPCVLWIGLVSILTAQYTWKNAVLLGTVLGPDEWGPSWHFWFVEALVFFLLIAAALFAIPGFDRFERANPFLVSGVLVAAGLLVRVGAVPGLEQRPSPAPAVFFFWFFAIGWWAARATCTWQRLVVSATIVVAVPGFWDAPMREGLIIAGLLVLVWFRTIRVPRLSMPLLTRLAAASLAIYLTHWLVFPPIEHMPVLALLVSLAVGVGVYEAARVAMKAVKSFSFWSAYASPYSTSARSARSPLPR